MSLFSPVVVLQVEDARSRFEQGARAFATLQERREDLIEERTSNASALPGLEQEKRVRQQYLGIQMAGVRIVDVDVFSSKGVPRYNTAQNPGTRYHIIFSCSCVNIL